MELLEELKKNGYSILTSDGYFSYDSGIKPVLFRVNDDRYFFRGKIVADKIIGKASAMLMCLSGVKEVYTVVLSKSGQKIFEDNGVPYHYEQLVEYIVNRKGDGLCPMEMTVKDVDDYELAYELLKKKVEELSGEK